MARGIGRYCSGLENDAFSGCCISIVRFGNPEKSEGSREVAAPELQFGELAA
uniref:Uncharacterized protein n=1 Tax=Oryza sativa subsp. japonica TaxID=39947 RepID=Q2R1K7_ORYSJ|nr:hypothetical protein LOC_Os11g38880 [Oryza sativa Japonica Group]